MNRTLNKSPKVSVHSKDCICTTPELTGYALLIGTFKLAAYGVKQGGIGSILAGGMGLRKKPGKQPSLDENQQATVNSEILYTSWRITN